MDIFCAWCGELVREAKGPGRADDTICMPCLVLRFPEEAEAMGIVIGAESEKLDPWFLGLILTLLAVFGFVFAALLWALRPWEW